MEIEDPKKEQIDLENETEIEPPSFNTYPKSLETNSKRPTFVKKINSQQDGLCISPSKISKLGNIRQTINNFGQKYQIHWINTKEFNEKNEEQSYSIFLDLPEVCTVEDCILMALKELNKILEKTKKGYTLIEKSKLYELFIAKKTGKPKEDYPSYDYELQISSTQNMNFALIQKNDDAIIFKANKEYTSSIESPHKKTVKFQDKYENPKSNNEIILLPDDDLNENTNRSFFMNLFCFCCATNKKKPENRCIVNKKE